MSPLLARVMLTIFMLPCAAVVYTIVMVVAGNSMRSGSYNSWTRGAPWLVAGAGCWAFIAFYWMLLWRRSVPWTSARIRGTLGATVLAAVAAAVAGVACAIVSFEFGFFVATTVAPLSWLILTTLAWRESAAEQAARLTSLGSDALVCPACGYNLTGLKGTRCPECGTEFTVDQLLSARKESSGAELT